MDDNMQEQIRELNERITAKLGKIKEDEKPEYMIFQLIDKTKEQALLSLVEEKGLTKKDILLILQTLELNQNVSVDILNKI